MIQVFLSHSRHDDKLAIRIAKDLKKENIKAWLYEWEILVGESISSEIQRALDKSKFIIVLLTNESIKSSWVQKEWQSLLYREVQTNEFTVLPIKGDKCKIPTLLQDKYYADISSNYDKGVRELITSIKQKSGNDNYTEKGLESRDFVNNINGDLMTQIEIKISKDYNAYSEKDQNSLMAAIKELLGGDSDIKITKIRPGSIIVKLEMSEKKAREFFKNFKKLMNKQQDITDAWMISDENNEEIDIKMSENYKGLAKTYTSPEIILDYVEGKLLINGRAITEDATMIFGPVLDWLLEYKTLSKNKFLNVSICMDYYNSGCSKYILQMFKDIKELENSNFKINIEWMVDGEDESMLEDIHDIESILDLDINIIPI